MNDTTKHHPDQQEPVTLLRALGLWTAMAVVIGNVIGSGIFVKPATIAANGGNFGLIITMWVLGGVLCILGALCFAELAAMFPNAGGMYIYLREAYGRPVAFLFGWTDYLIRLPGSIAALSVVFVGQVVYALGWNVPEFGQVLMVAVLIVGMAWVNVVGVVWGGRVQVVTTIIKAGVLGLVAAAPFLLWPFVAESFDTANFATHAEPEQAGFGARIGAILLAVMWAYNGWHGVTPLAEEIREPQRNIPLALFGGVGILIVLYVSANVAYHSVLSMDEMKAIGQASQGGKSATVGITVASEMLRQMIGGIGATIVAGVIMCSTFGAINTNFLQSPRIPFAMSRDGAFFRRLGRVHPTYRTPAAAICVAALLSVLLIVAVTVAKHFIHGIRTDSVFDLLTNLVIFSSSIFYLLAVLAVIVLRIKSPELKRPYRTWGYPVVPILFVAAYVLFLYQIDSGKPFESRAGIVLILTGLPFYFCLWHRPSKRGAMASKENQ